MVKINFYNKLFVSELVGIHLKQIQLMKYLVFIYILVSTLNSYSQVSKKLNANEIHESIEKLNFLGSVLYLAAHPDDENTRLISYFSNEVHARTAYLSLTRGDGGQNLIGPEIRELLGVIRTNELLQARRIDGGEQFFTRANDFGYSKHPKETLQIWNKEEILNDVVKVVRSFQPDIIINRFNIESAGKTHGHHTSSAMLSTEAFGLAADSNYKTVNQKPWKVKRMFFNTSWWFYGSKEKFEKADKSKMIEINTGVYFPNSGLSNTEIASLSRSMHKSQGFGSTGSRGDENEYIQLIKGEMPRNQANLFEGIDTSWNRVKGGSDIKKIMDMVEKEFDFKDPSASIPYLVQAYLLIDKLEDDYWREFKSVQIKEIIAACAGLYLEAKVNDPYAALNDKIQISLEAINRSDLSIILKGLSFLPQNKSLSVNKELKNNIPFNLNEEIMIPSHTAYTNPYWLNLKGSLGMYQVEDKNEIGKPLSEKEFRVNFKFEINKVPLDFIREIVYKYNDPVKGEVIQPFEIVPIVSSSLASNVVIFNIDGPKKISVKIKALKDNVKGESILEVPNNWKVEPKSIPFGISNKGVEKIVFFTVTPPKVQSEGYIISFIQSEGKVLKKSLVEIDYDHIPKQTIALPSKAKVVRLDLVTKGNEIGYIKGAGDMVPQYLEQIGYRVSIIDPENISKSALKKFDAIIIGIRAYNTVEELKFKQNIILDYVKNGGNLIVQYNTSHNLKVKENIAPYALQLSRDRVTDENAEVKFLAPNHELLNFPNKITKHDFEGWVQERGLYFPNKWSKEFTPVLSMHDNGESSKKGSVLIAKYGKGNYIYTGLSFFRELPAGVPGAYKLIANMISVGKNNVE